VSDPKFFQKGFEKILSLAIEVCGEFLAAAGKTQRWGPDSYDPTIPPYKRVANLVWLQQELADVQEAMTRLQEAINEEYT
jgi:hypothetical protein